MRNRFHQLIIVGLLHVVALTCSAQAEDFEIDNYSVAIRIADNAEIQVEENIDVRFSRPRHGIFRKIPYKYRTNSALGTFTTDIYDIEVLGESWQREFSGSDIVIRIGEAHALVSGTRRYTIRYKVFGAIQFHSGFSELYWNAIGLGWDVPIHRAYIQVLAPSRVSLASRDFFAYTGPFGSTACDARVIWDGVGLSVATYRSLNPREGITVGLKFPDGFLIDGSLEMRVRLLLKNYGMLLVPLATLFVLTCLWIRYGRDVAFTKMVFYRPPNGITSAEAGVLRDDKVDNSDLTSLIIAWAVSGAISIREVQDEGFFKATDLELRKEYPLPSDARAYERLMFDQLFLQGDVVRVGSLKDKFYSTMRLARKALEAEIERRKLYEPESRALTRSILAVASLLFIAAFLLSYVKFINPFECVCIVVAGLICKAFARIMPKKNPYGNRLYRQVVGFKEFMQRVEAPQLKRLLEDDPLYFDKTLPYAVVFGCAATWAARFEGLLSTPPTWYYSQSGNSFSSPAELGSALDSGMQTISSAFSSSPNSSGSGGSSGGGGGGGGGGSW